MRLKDFFIILVLDIIIIRLAAKTKIYAKIISIIIKIAPYIVILFILFAPPLGFIFLLIICNSIFTSSPEANILQIATEYSILKDLKEFGLHIITYSPIYLLIFCFIYQASLYLKSKKEENDNVNKIKIAFFRMKTSILVNNITIVLCALFLIINYNTDIVNLYFVEYILHFSFYKLDIHSEITIKIILINILGFLYYISIFMISGNFIDNVIIYTKEINEKILLKPWKYKLLNYIPFFNIFLIYIMDKMLSNIRISPFIWHKENA